MALDHFIPQVWDARILDALHKTLVFAEFYNQDYEGTISEMGDTVHIGMVQDVTVKSFDCEQDLDSPEDVKVNDQTLKIDQGDYFNISVCDVDMVQSAANLLDSATSQAGYNFGDKADQYLAKQLADAAGITVTGTDETPTAVTEQNAYSLIVAAKVALDKANCPKQGRKIALPADFEGFMLLDSRFVRVGTDASNDRLEEGTIYRAAGFEIRTTNNCPTFTYGGNKTGYKFIASVQQQGTFANQILKTEAYRPEKRFADAVKGLHVYGAKTVRPEIVAVGKVSF